jgi:hypothetical protein
MVSATPSWISDPGLRLPHLLVGGDVGTTDHPVHRLDTACRREGLEAG